MESANRYLKTFLIRGSSTILEVVKQLFEMVKAMEVNIREARQRQKNRLRRDYLGKQWLGDTPIVITEHALALVTIEHRHMESVVPSITEPNPSPLTPYTNQFTTQFGIPCRHELLRRHQAKDLVLQKADFHLY